MNQAPPEEELGEIQPGRLAVQTLVGIGLFMLGLLALGTFYREETLRISRECVETFGGPGVFGAWVLLDFFPGPFIPPDVFTTFAVVGGMGFWETVIWASLGSQIGAILAWVAGRRLGRTRFYLRLIQTGAPRRIFHLVERHQALTLALGAVTPMPYALTCWLCAAAGMPFNRFLLVCQLRPLRIISYLWLFGLGAVSAIG